MLLLALPALLPSPSPAVEPDIRRDAAVIATEQVTPSVVNIATETVLEYHDWYDDMLRQFYGWQRTPVRQQRSVSLGSGVIIDEEGYVLTNFHVVRRASRIQVKLWDGREYDADPVAPVPGSDVALVKIRAKPGEKFKAIKFAPDDDLLLGETVLALGNPYGLGNAVTKGILSSKNRRPSSGDEPLNVEDWLQTDAAINPGNSGGPLVNLRGELIGLNVAVYRDPKLNERGPGVSFSIPVKQVCAALSHCFSPEVTDALWLGAQFKLTWPLLVTAVQPGSPAASAGLRVGDQVLQVNNQTPRNLIACNRLISTAPHHTASILVNRTQQRLTLTTQLVPFPDLIRQKLGLTLTEVTPQTAQQLGIQPGENLLIETVEKNSPADRAELKAGYLLAGIEGKTASEVKTVAEVLPLKKKGESVHLSLIVPRRAANYLELRQATVDLEVR